MPTIKEMISQQREAHPEAGKVVGGFYALDSSLGSGGFGCVWKAKDRHLKDHGFVAIKFLGGFKAKEESAIASLKNEFAILKDLNHPHINKVYDFGRDPKFGYYVVTELVDGLPLQKAFFDRDADFCEAIIVQILRALAYIHSRGVFHFDIKPPNVVVKGNNHAVLIDFGIAALQPAEKAVGSLSFMAPEMIMHQMPDGRADLYSVGVLFYSILTGGNPFISMSFEEAKEKHLKLNVPPPSSVRPNIPSYFDKVVARLLEKNPSDRYQSALEVLRDINLLSAKKYEIETVDTRISYIPVEGRLIGRKYERDLFSEFIEGFKEGVVNCRVFKITGGKGAGKTRLLNDLKYSAALAGINVIGLLEANESEIQKVLEELGNLLTSESKPTLVIFDDFDKFCSSPFGKSFLDMMDVFRKKEKSRISFALSASVDCAESLMCKDVQLINLGNFTREEVVEYISSIASPPQDVMAMLADEILLRTKGNPALIASLFSQLIGRGFFVDAGGRWNPQLFRDIVIDFGDIDVPEAIAKPVISNINKLNKEERRLLNEIAVAGRFAGVPAKKIEGLLHLGWIKYDIRQACCVVVDEFTRRCILQALNAEEAMLLHDKAAKYLKKTKALEHEIDEHVAYGSDKSSSHAALIRLTRHERHHGLVGRALERLAERLKIEKDAGLIEELVLELGESYFHIRDYNKVDELCILYSNDKMRLLHCRSLIERGDLEKAENALNKFLGPKTKNYLAKIKLLQGRFDEAVALYSEVKKNARKLAPAEQLEVLSDNELGEALRLKGELDKAIPRIKDEFAFFERANALHRAVVRCYSLAEACRSAGQNSEAGKYFKIGIKIGKELADSKYLSRLYNGYGSLLISRHKLKEAIAQLEEGLAHCYRTGDLMSAAIILLNIGHCYNDEKKLKKAKEYLTTSLAFFESGKCDIEWAEGIKCQVYLELGDVLRQEQDYNNAAAYLEKAEQIAVSRSDLKQYLSNIKSVKKRLKNGKASHSNC